MCAEEGRKEGNVKMDKVHWIGSEGWRRRKKVKKEVKYEMVIKSEICKGKEDGKQDAT